MPVVFRSARASKEVRALLGLAWVEFNARLLEIEDEQLLRQALFHEQRRKPPRSQYVRRLYARFSTVRRRHELTDMNERDN